MVITLFLILKTRTQNWTPYILNEKANLGSADLEEADKECCNQKWLSPIHVVEELGYTTKYSHRIELSESGESQIEKFWRESKYNPDNVWKSRVVKWSSVITAIISLVYFLACLCQLIQNSVKK